MRVQIQKNSERILTSKHFFQAVVPQVLGCPLVHVQLIKKQARKETYMKKQ